MPKIVLTDKPDGAAIQHLVRGLTDFNVQQGGPRNAATLAILVSDEDSGEVLGGLLGGTAYGYLKIEILYLPESLRGTGLGTRLMQQAEEEAVRRGCRAAWLETFTFQAQGFYERLGYSVFGEIEDYPAGHSMLFLKKTLAPVPAASPAPAAS
jgi:GNAT superfamily N-acetyltransferase